MTGIGFLGAGVIIHEGLAVRGLTTAASIWTTAAMGIPIGSGSHGTACAATVLMLSTLSVVRWIEDRMPTQAFVHGAVRFARSATMPEAALRAVLARHGFAINEISYRLTDAAAYFEYRMALRTHTLDNMRALADALAADAAVREFRLAQPRLARTSRHPQTQPGRTTLVIRPGWESNGGGVRVCRRGSGAQWRVWKQPWGCVGPGLNGSGRPSPERLNWARALPAVL